MDKDGGMKAVKELDGIRMAGSPKPLSVQPYVSHLVVHVGVIIEAEIYRCVCSKFSCRRGIPRDPLSKPS